MITMTSTGIIDDAGGHFAAWDIHKPKIRSAARLSKEGAKK
jgi:hypothetical protein